MRPTLRDLINQVFRDVPCGTGGSGFVKIGARDLDKVLTQGARWMVENGRFFSAPNRNVPDSWNHEALGIVKALAVAGFIRG